LVRDIIAILDSRLNHAFEMIVFDEPIESLNRLHCSNSFPNWTLGVCSGLGWSQVTFAEF